MCCNHSKMSPISSQDSSICSSSFIYFIPIRNELLLLKKYFFENDNDIFKHPYIVFEQLLQLVGFIIQHLAFPVYQLLQTLIILSDDLINSGFSFSNPPFQLSPRLLQILPVLQDPAIDFLSLRFIMNQMVFKLFG